MKIWRKSTYRRKLPGIFGRGRCCRANLCNGSTPLIRWLSEPFIGGPIIRPPTKQSGDQVNHSLVDQSFEHLQNNLLSDTFIGGLIIRPPTKQSGDQVNHSLVDQSFEHLQNNLLSDTFIDGPIIRHLQNNG